MPGEKYEFKATVEVLPYSRERFDYVLKEKSKGEVAKAREQLSLALERLSQPLVDWCAAYQHVESALASVAELRFLCGMKRLEIMKEVDR